MVKYVHSFHIKINSYVHQTYCSRKLCSFEAYMYDFNLNRNVHTQSKTNEIPLFFYEIYTYDNMILEEFVTNSFETYEDNYNLMIML